MGGRRARCKPLMRRAEIDVPDDPAGSQPRPAERGFDRALFRAALGQFATGVTIVTALSEGRPVGMTANSFASVSLEPPLVLWSVARDSANHDAFESAASFAVHILGAGHGELALTFAGRRGERFGPDLAYAIGRSGAPVIEGVAPVFECRTWARYPGGDHTILVGEVTDLVTRPGEPLVFHSGVFKAI